MRARGSPIRRGIRRRACRSRWAVSASASPTSPCSMPALPKAARRGLALLKEHLPEPIIGCSALSPPGICAKSSTAFRCPKAGRWARVSRANAQSASRPVPPTASATPGRWDSPTTIRWASGSAVPTARRARAASAARPQRPSCSRHFDCCRTTAARAAAAARRHPRALDRGIAARPAGLHRGARPGRAARHRGAAARDRVSAQRRHGSVAGIQCEGPDHPVQGGWWPCAADLAGRRAAARHLRPLPAVLFHPRAKDSPK